MRIGVAILAAGKGERFGGDKISPFLGSRPVWRWSFDTFQAHPRIDSVGIVTSPGREADFDGSGAAFVVPGGADRQASSRLGIEACESDFVLIHDAARPFVSAALIDRVIGGIERVGASAPGIPAFDTLRYDSRGIDRAKVIIMQTPQGGRRDLLLRAHTEATQLETDEMALIEATGSSFELVQGDPMNFKITTAQDLEHARRLVASEVRTGFGYDIHRFSDDPSRPLMLAGVRFDGQGLEGHSDADVVIHAVVDALLGAAALGDIGEHFPNTDPRWQGEPSRTFLTHAVALLSGQGWFVSNVDIAVIAEHPRLMPRAAELRANLAAMLGIAADRIGFKATTNEGLGALGQGEGMAAHAVATLVR